eukprot:TRINITY_DN738_c0_g1_i2.p1 TRINITY_DN738_c0_g1~~TRINITY_DN738_c0_g1_i2.p1  ORF type:complete len:140 (+),score=21.98 TRINITY_DN738_c0_g1_i2:123-542(+)
MGLNLEKFQSQTRNWKISFGVLCVIVIIFIIVGGVLTVGGPEVCDCGKLDPTRLYEGDEICPETCEEYACANTNGCHVKLIPGVCARQVCAETKDKNQWGDIAMTNGRFIGGIILLFFGVVAFAVIVGMIWKVTDSSQQ